MAEIKLEITDEARQTIADMEGRVTLIGQMYGENSKEYVTALRSFAQVLATMIRLGGRIVRDGDLSLCGSSSITYGVIWFGKRGEDGTRDPVIGDWSVHS